VLSIAPTRSRPPPKGAMPYKTAKRGPARSDYAQAFVSSTRVNGIGTCALARYRPQWGMSCRHRALPNALRQVSSCPFSVGKRILADPIRRCQRGDRVSGVSRIQSFDRSCPKPASAAAKTDAALHELRHLLAQSLGDSHRTVGLGGQETQYVAGAPAQFAGHGAGLC